MRGCSTCGASPPSSTPSCRTPGFPDRPRPQGEPVERNVSGFADPRFRLSVNLYGAPALTLKEFKDYEQDLIVGASLQVSVPSGQYDASRLVNIGTNRWSFKPEVGVSKALGPWTLEFQAAARSSRTTTISTGGNTRSQDPIYSMQGHVDLRLSVGYLGFGRRHLLHRRPHDAQRHAERAICSRTGVWAVRLAFPVDVHNSVKLYASSGVSARTGNSYDLLGIAWQYRWGAGL